MIEQNFALRGGGVVARLASATACGVAFGILTLWLQGRLPGDWNVLADSGAVWTVVAVLVAAVTGSSVASAATAGALALLGEVAGYYWCAAPWHGVAVTHGEQLLWTAAAVVVGPFAGLVGFGLALGSVTQRVMSLLAVAGLLAGEGWYGLRDLAQHRHASRVEVAAGLVIGLLALLLSRATLRRRAAALIVGATVAGAVLFFYSAPTLVL